MRSIQISKKKENTTTKTVLITGATSGFGAAMAQRFAQAWWRVVATGRRAERLRTLVDKFGAETIFAVPFDVRDMAAMNDTLSTIPEPFREIDVLINNAGLALGTAPAPEARLDDWLRMIETNVTGLVTLTHKLLPTLIERKGSIINLGSVAGSYPYPGGNVYGATKAFVRQFSLDLRSDLHGTGVRVTSIEPGLAQTEFTFVRTGGDQAASDSLYKSAHPLTAEDIAETVFWIATQPPYVNINRLELMPVSQSWAGFQVYRDPRAERDSEQTRNAG
jgi:serine 3-dehydrogenase